MGTPVPFDTNVEVEYCSDLDTRDLQVQENMLRVLKRVQPGEKRHERIAVVGYGPSLKQWPITLREYDYIITCSGAHGYLLERGIVPTWHIEVDPRPHKAAFVTPSHPDVKYLVASTCHPSIIDALQGRDVALWHLLATEPRRRHVTYTYERNDWALNGGTNIGMRAIVMAAFLGFCNIDVFGMDCSFEDEGAQHAGPHGNEQPGSYLVDVGGRVFRTNPALHSYARRFLDDLKAAGNVNVRLYGDGLLQAHVKDKLGDTVIVPEDPSILLQAFAMPDVITGEYAQLNKAMHAKNASYGTSGARYADKVRALVEFGDYRTVLDYGCGKGTLGRALPFAIWEYDPAIPGKDKAPRPADLVVCTDVLEHVEPDLLRAVLLDLRRVTIKEALIVVHTGPAQKTLPDGRNTHLIQQPAEWWVEKLSEHFEVLDSTTTASHVELFVRAKGAAGARASEQPREPFVTVSREDTRVNFYVPNEVARWRVQTFFTKEPHTLEWIDSFQPGDIFWDVGANMGGYSLWAEARRGVHVRAFEPEAESYALLNRNIRLNSSKARAYCLAFDNVAEPCAGTLALSMPGAAGSGHSIDRQPSLDLPQLAQGCYTTALDQFAHSISEYPHHLKIDVDGVEDSIIGGAPTVLENLHSLCIEVNTNSQRHRAMIRSLEDMGFEFDPVQVAGAMRRDGPFKGYAEYVFRRPIIRNAVEKHLVDLIRDAIVLYHPFPHIYIENAWPDGFIGVVQDAFAKAEFRSLQAARGTGGYPQRTVADVPQCLAWLNEGAVRDALNRKFGVRATASEALLMRDAPGYAIGPHTDTPGKVVTALFYVTRSWTEAEHGTSLYRHRNNNRDTEGKHNAVNDPNFIEVWRAPGKPGSVLIFPRSNFSYHGAQPYEGTKHREILLFDTRR